MSELRILNGEHSKIEFSNSGSATLELEEIFKRVP